MLAPRFFGGFCSERIQSYCLYDIDGNGCDDVLVGTRDLCTGVPASYSLTVIEADGTPIPGFPISLGVESRPTSIAVADLEFDFFIGDGSFLLPV